MNLSNHFTLLFFVLNCLITFTNSKFRIANGKTSDIKDHSYLAALFYQDEYYCVGSLVTLQVVITAASCTKTARISDITVVAGITNINELGKRRKVQKVIYPPHYGSKLYHADIGAIKLSASFTASNKISTIQPCSSKLERGTEMLVSGWGASTYRRKRINQLQSTKVSIVSQNECITPLKKILSKLMICAEGKETGVGYGDTGAPGVVNRQICAVASSGANCGNTQYPHVYTNANAEQILKFINGSMKM